MKVIAVTMVMPISMPILSLTPFLKPTAAVLAIDRIVFGPGVIAMAVM